MDEFLTDIFTVSTASGHPSNCDLTINSVVTGGLTTRFVISEPEPNACHVDFPVLVNVFRVTGLPKNNCGIWHRFHLIIVGERYISVIPNNRGLYTWAFLCNSADAHCEH